MNILFIIQHLSDSLKHVQPNMAVLPLAVPIALSALSSVPNWIAGFKQKQQAEELQKSLKRPDFEIPEAAKTALQSAQNQAAMTRLPGQSAVEGSLNQNTANQLDTIERMGPGGATSLNAAGQVYGGQQKATTDLGIAAAGNWNQNQAALRDQLGRMSEWEFQQWNWDKKLPYENKATAIRALNEGSMRNIDNAAKDLFGGAANIFLSEHLMDKSYQNLRDLLPKTPETNIGSNLGDIIGNQDSKAALTGVLAGFPESKFNGVIGGEKYNAGTAGPWDYGVGTGSPIDLRPIMPESNPFGGSMYAKNKPGSIDLKPIMSKLDPFSR